MLQTMKEGANETSMHLIAFIMADISWERFEMSHGHYNACTGFRLFYGNAQFQPSKMFTISSVLLFYFPSQYMDGLLRFPEDLAHSSLSIQIKDFVEELQKDWESSILPSTVLLSVNVGLLAIQSIDTGLASRSLAQIACYISIFFTLGNIALCVILAPQCRASRDWDAARNYIANRRRMGGLSTLAITISLPRAFFLYGMFTFFIAVVWVCLHHTSLGTRLSTGLVALLVTLAVGFVSLLEFLSKKDDEEIEEFLPVRTWRRLKRVLVGGR